VKAVQAEEKRVVMNKIWASGPSSKAEKAQLRNGGGCIADLRARLTLLT